MASSKSPSSRSDIVQEVAAACMIPQSQAENVIRAFESAVVRSLKGGGEVRLTGFGSFKVSNRAARTARNPQTGGMVKVAARKVPRFTPGQAFKDAVGGKSTAAKKAAPAKAAKKPAAKGKKK